MSVGAWLAAATRVVTGCRARWVGCEPALTPRVYYANHASHLDALVIWSSLPAALRRRCCIVAAADYWNRTLTRRYLSRRVFKTILVDREHVARDNNPVDAMAAALDAEDSLVIFPEGTRGAGEMLGEFHSGVWHLARRRPQLEFVPVWLENMNRILPKGEILPVPVIGGVAFGAPLRAEIAGGKERFLGALRAALAATRDRK